MIAPRVPGLVLLAAGVAIGLEATTFDVAFMTDPVGPKALPYLVGLTLVIAGLRTAIQGEVPESIPSGRVLRKLMWAVAAFLAYSLALDVIGFVVSTALVVAALSHLYGAPPKKGMAAATLFSVSLWALFVYVLALPLPIGSLWMR